MSSDDDTRERLNTVKTTGGNVRVTACPQVGIALAVLLVAAPAAAWPDPRDGLGALSLDAWGVQCFSMGSPNGPGGCGDGATLPTEILHRGSSSSPSNSTTSSSSSTTSTTTTSTTSSLPGTEPTTDDPDGAPPSIPFSRDASVPQLDALSSDAPVDPPPLALDVKPLSLFHREVSPTCRGSPDMGNTQAAVDGPPIVPPAARAPLSRDGCRTAAPIPPAGPGAASAAPAAALAPSIDPNVTWWFAVAGVSSLALLLAAFGYSRLRPDRALEHPLRAQLVDAIQAQPGIHFEALRRLFGLSRGQLEHHLRTLVHTGHAAVHAGPRYTCYFPPGQVDRRLMHAAAILKSQGARRVLASIVREPGRSVAGAAERAGISRPTTTEHVARLRAAGLVDAQRAGREVRLHATPTGVLAAAQ